MPYCFYKYKANTHNCLNLASAVAAGRTTSAAVTHAGAIVTVRGASLGTRQGEFDAIDDLRLQFGEDLPPVYMTNRIDLLWFTADREQTIEEFCAELVANNATIDGPYFDWVASPALIGTPIPTPPASAQDPGSEPDGCFASHANYDPEDPRSANMQWMESLFEECGYEVVHKRSGPWGGFRHVWEPRIVRDWGDPDSPTRRIWYNQAVMDLTNPAWQNGFVAFMIALAQDAGFDGVSLQCQKVSTYVNTTKATIKRPQKHGTWLQVMSGARSIPTLENQCSTEVRSIEWDPRTMVLTNGDDFRLNIHVGKTGNGDKYNLYDDHGISAYQYFTSYIQIFDKLRIACDNAGLLLMCDLFSHGSSMTRRVYPIIPQMMVTENLTREQATAVFWGQLLNCIQQSDAAILELDVPLSPTYQTLYGRPVSWEVDLTATGTTVFVADRGDIADSYYGVDIPDDDDPPIPGGVSHLTIITPIPLTIPEETIPYDRIRPDLVFKGRIKADGTIEYSFNLVERLYRELTGGAVEMAPNNTGTRSTNVPNLDEASQEDPLLLALSTSIYGAIQQYITDRDGP